jgi:putative membrane protein
MGPICNDGGLMPPGKGEWALKAFARLLKRDIVRLLKTPAALGVVLVLIVLPSLYTWYNVVGFWNPYDNTKNLKVCVVNEDAGTYNDLTGEINVGDMVVEGLEEDDQLGWTFVDYDEAMDELESAEAYAVFVIPEDFSEKLMTITTGDFEQPDLQYYVNEKTAPVAPRIMDAGSTELDRSINSMFRATVGDVLVNVLDDAITSSEEARDNVKSNAAAQLTESIDALDDARDSISQADDALTQGQTTVSDAQATLDEARSAVDDASTLLDSISQETSELQQTLSGYSTSLAPGTTETIQQLADVSTQANQAISELSTTLSSTETDVSSALAQAQASLTQAQQLAQDMRTAAEGLDDSDPIKTQLLDAADELDSQASELSEKVSELQELDQQAQDTEAQLQTTSTALNNAITQAMATQSAVSSEYFTTTLPAIDQSLANLSITAASLSSLIDQQELLIDEADTLLDQTSSVMGLGTEAVSQTDSLLQSATENLDSVRSDILSMSDSGKLAELLDNGTIDAESVASFIGSPTHVSTEQLYPVSSYGAAMAPLFMNLTFWIGAFMLLVVMRQEIDSEGVEDASLTAKFMARYVLFGILVVLQAVVCCTGLEIIGIRPVNDAALFVAAALTSLAYLSIIYSLSVTMQHVGKGLCIILVFAQIPGASGLYPIEMTSAFFQAIAPFFPFTYGIGAMREAICGFYDGTYLHDLAILGVFAAAALVLGIKVRPLLANVNRMMADQVHESGIFNGEKVDEPYRPYRVTQIVAALSTREEFRANLAERYDRFMRRYPHIVRIALVSNIVVPVVACAVMALTTTEKTVMLTIWLVWLVVTFVVLIAVEAFQQSLKRQFELDGMSEENLIEEFRRRGKDQGSSRTHTVTERAHEIVEHVSGATEHALETVLRVDTGASGADAAGKAGAAETSHDDTVVIDRVGTGSDGAKASGSDTVKASGSDTVKADGTGASQEDTDEDNASDDGAAKGGESRE